MASSKTKKKTTGLTTKEVRNLVHEIITFSTDKIGTTTAQLLNEGHLDRDQAEKVISSLEAVIKDAAFQVLSTKNL
tara:strand:- start:1468 stop:1695 length:228 start_codon:yes stop_codon:yes gene_type:complete